MFPFGAQHQEDVVPAGGDFPFLAFARQDINHRAGLVAFRLPVFLELPPAFLYKEFEHEIVGVASTDAEVDGGLARVLRQARFFYEVGSVHRDGVWVQFIMLFSYCIGHFASRIHFR